MTIFFNELFGRRQRPTDDLGRAFVDAREQLLLLIDLDRLEMGPK
jgi:hypothetical protein